MRRTPLLRGGAPVMTQLHAAERCPVRATPWRRHAAPHFREPIGCQNLHPHSHDQPAPSSRKGERAIGPAQPGGGPVRCRQRGGDWAPRSASAPRSSAAPVARWCRPARACWRHCSVKPRASRPIRRWSGGGCRGSRGGRSYRSGRSSGASAATRSGRGSRVRSPPRTRRTWAICRTATGCWRTFGRRWRCSSAPSRNPSHRNALTFL